MHPKPRLDAGRAAGPKGLTGIPIFPKMFLSVYNL
jgi:hypothetical protein